MYEQKANHRQEIMERSTVSEQSTQLEKLAIDALAAGYGLKVALVYEDAETRGWCREVFERAAKVAGQQAISATWWNMADLVSSGVLDGAVSTAMRADVIVVASRATEDLPLAFYVWAEAWAAHRVTATGALVALVASRETQAAEGRKLREYLMAAARQARMELIVEERSSEGGGFVNAQGAASLERLEIGPGDTEFLTMAFAV